MVGVVSIIGQMVILCVFQMQLWKSPLFLDKCCLCRRYLRMPTLLIELTLNETGHSFAVVRHEFLGKLSHESAGEGEVFAVFPTALFNFYVRAAWFKI